MDNTKLHIILATHHRSAGNFDHVIEEAYRKAYLPSFKEMERLDFGGTKRVGFTIDFRETI